MSERFELHLEQTVEEPYERLLAALRAGPDSWLPGFDEKNGRTTGELTYEQAGSRIRRRIEARIGPVQRFAYGVTVRVEWRAAQRSELYPELEGHLRLEPRPPSGSSLRFDARYTPPGSRIGARVDRALMHHVAEASVRDFLAGVARRLSDSST